MPRFRPSAANEDFQIAASPLGARLRKVDPQIAEAPSTPASAIREDFKIGVTPPADSGPTETESAIATDEDRDARGNISSFMRPELFIASTTGDVDAFEGVVGSDAENTVIGEVTPGGNSVLHLAGSFGNDMIVRFILQKYPRLAELENHKGDLALHAAASAGHLPVIRSLVSFAQRYAVGANLLRKKNRQGNTPLHVALEHGQTETALFLVQADPQVSYCLNKEGKSPFYMATESGHWEIVKSITEHPSSHQLEDCQLLHASIIGRNKDVMDEILSIDSRLVHSTDKEGRTPLSLAASIGFVDGVCYILDKAAESAYLRDRRGFFPIHWACKRGHIDVIDAFLRRLPDSAELLNKKGENILHVAAKNGRAKLVSWMLKLSKLDMLINEKDERGFTPLHWATSHCHPKVVSILTWDKRVNLEITSNKGLTALDIAEQHIYADAPFRGRLTRTALKSANAPRSAKAKTRREMAMAGRMFNSGRGPDRERVNTLLLVATLVATVTFSCGFQLPGGINNSDSDAGTATMVKKSAFQAFLICNTAALYSSLLVAVTLIWAQLGDLNLVINTLRVAVPLLGMSLTAMASAFISGVYLVVSNHHWLPILVLIMGSISIVILSAVFFPLCFPLSSKHRIVRYLVYYPFELMILVTRSDIEKVIEA